MHQNLYLSVELQDLIFLFHIKQVLENYSESIFLLFLNNLKLENIIFKSISLNIFFKKLNCLKLKINLSE